MKNFALNNDTLRHFFNAKCVQKWTAMALFLTLLDRFKNHILWTQTNEKTCTFLTDVKKINFLLDALVGIQIITFWYLFHQQREIFLLLIFSTKKLLN
jgi:hypothetical protein